MIAYVYNVKTYHEGKCYVLREFVGRTTFEDAPVREMVEAFLKERFAATFYAATGCHLSESPAGFWTEESFADVDLEPDIAPAKEKRPARRAGLQKRGQEASE